MNKKILFIFACISILLVYGCAQPEEELPVNRSVDDTITAGQGSEDVEKRVEEIRETWLPDSDKLYTANLFPAGTEIHVVDEETDEDKVIYTSDQDNLLIYAIPRFEFDGEIFLIKTLPDSDNPSVSMYSFDINKGGEPRLLSFSDELPFNFFDAVELSLEEDRIVVAYDNANMGEDSKEIVIYNLLTEEKEVVGKVDNDEYLSEYNGPNIFTGASEYDIFWSGPNCVSADVYMDDPEQGEGSLDFEHKKLKEIRQYCF